MLQSNNIVSKYIINSNIQKNYYEFNKDEYNQIKKLLLVSLILDSMVKILGACFELNILNIIRKNLLNGLSAANVFEITMDLLEILMFIYADKNLLEQINTAKQQLKLIKENDIETLKRLSKTIK